MTRPSLQTRYSKVTTDINYYVLTEDKRQAKQFCFLDADCLVVGKSQDSF